VGIVVILAVIFFLAAVVFVLFGMHNLNQQLKGIALQFEEKFKQTSSVLQDTHRTIGERLDSATRIFGEVQKSLGKLEETHRQIYEISKDISSLQDLLRAPKFRGEMGETLLAKLLEDILPKEYVRFQHRFKSGDIVDAAVIVGQHLICIDAKFPLENFKKSNDARSDGERRLLYRNFVRDVKKRVEEVSSKYILPDEGTFDFALMYIPAEAVYYEIIRDEELCMFAKGKKVIFVSPNTFYAYLQAILYGLKGAVIQHNIRKIFGELLGLQAELKKFQGDFDVIGKHLTDAASRYKEATVRLGHINERFNLTIKRPDLEQEKEEG